MNKVSILKGGKFTNEKGTIKFANEFDFKGIKRFYAIELPKRNLIRAFHGHFKESKSVFVTSGSLLLCVVKLDDKKNPSKNNKVKKIILDSQNPQIVNVPAGFANGIMSLEKNTQVIFYSNKSVKDSEADDYRFPEDYWGKEIWQ